MAKCRSCSKRASYGIINTKRALYCVKHKSAEHVDIVSKTCQHPNCKKQPTYGLINTKNALYCAEHKSTEHVDIKNKTCQQTNCKKQPNFGLVNTKIALYCAEHKSAEHVNVKHKTCQHPNCKTLPTYGLINTKKALYCVEHKKANHVDLKHKTCQHPNCKKQPVFGVINTKNALYCAEHKSTEHVDIKNKTCQHPYCKTLPTYGLINTKNALYCAEHKSAEHVDIKNKTCQYPNCKTRPTFGLVNTKIGLYCAEHKSAEHVDIKNKTCQYPNCQKRASYGKPGYSNEYCSVHKLDGMILNSTKYKLDEFKTCEYCACKINYKDQYCSACKLYLSLGKTAKRHAKEEAIKALLDTYEIKYTHDLIVKDGCSKKRPDFIINTTWGTIILEVDEHQHNRKTYSCECELQRMKMLYFDIGVENVLFIRYNPDEYALIGSAEFTDSKRQQFLIQYLQRIMSEQVKGLNVVYLFYDWFIHTQKPELELIDPYK